VGKAVNQEDPFLDSGTFSVGRRARCRTFATFESECPECGWEIEVGEAIEPGADGDWMHEGCAE
jgi:hypothetical protein